MVKRENKRRRRRVLILALLLLIPALLSDLPLFSKMGHRPHRGAGTQTAALSASGGALALAPGEVGALQPKHGRKHWHTASGDAGDDDLGGGGDGVLQNLVFPAHGGEFGDGNAPLSDGDSDEGWGFGGGHGGGSGGGAPFGPNPGGFGGPGYDPGTDILPLAFTPDTDGGDGNKGGNGGDGPSFPSPTIPSIAAVPEPATWAFFILGFGFIGAQLRRARDAQRAPALTRARSRRLG